MKHLIFISIAATLTLTACGGGKKGDSSADPEVDTVAQRYGRQHAALLIEADPDTTAMRRIILETRSYETKLRQEGLNYSADDYIQAFEEHIRANDSTLAADILD